MTQNFHAEFQRRPPALQARGSFREPSRPNGSGRIGSLSAGTDLGEEVVDPTSNLNGASRGDGPSKRRKLNTDLVKEESPHTPSSVSQAVNDDGANDVTHQVSSSERPPWQLPVLRWPEEEKKYIKRPGFQSPPPLPSRPGRRIRQDVFLSARAEKDRSIPKREVETSPYKMSAPGDAPHLHNDNYLADFFPWKGSHAEDNLAREFVRDGYYSKTKFPFNLPHSRLAAENSSYTSGSSNPGAHESVSTARGFHRSFQREPPMLSSLSAVFTAVLERRKSHGKLSSGSTFKPPPRVTLTEAKRKAWLTDLANPTVPLRRLNRTIPQGIRGQPLLEQCLVNGIPISRAIWFAKCVGANEIRTLKRKGTSASFAASAESKWLKEWTSCIEALLESILDNCGAPDWNAKVNYCIELGTRLYNENLLDREHYLDWLVKTISKSATDRLPIWLLLLHIHAKELGLFRKRGRLLAVTILDHLSAVLHDDVEIMKPLIDKLAHFIRSFTKACPACFVLPRSWGKYRQTIEYCLDLDTTTDQELFDMLEKRNAKFFVSNASDLQKPTSRVQALIDILDKARPPFDLVDVSSRCLKIGWDHSSLVTNLLEWSATRFRTGLERQYLAVRLLRRWSKQGLDIETPIHDMVNGVNQSQDVEIQSVYMVVAELVRSKTFSISRYLQWLMACGGEGRSDHPGLQLLLNLPVRCLPEHIKHLRNAVLDRVGFALKDEVDTVQQAKAVMASALPNIFGSPNVGLTKLDIKSQIRKLNGSAKFEISYWIRENVAQHYHEVSGKLDSQQDEVPDISKLTVSEFELLRGVLEFVGDVPILADFLFDASNSDDEGVLAAAADTVNHHYAVLSMVGAFNELHRSLFEAYRRLRVTGSLLRNFTLSLMDLATQVPSSIMTVKSLSTDLARGERNAPIAACSPISDHMAETLHNAGSSFNDEFEQLLSTGTSLDDQAMASLFRALTARLENGSADKKASPESYCQMLCRLRVFRPKHFDSLMGKWLERLLQNPNQTILDGLFLPLISFNCTNLQTIFIIGKDLLSADAARPGIVNAKTVRGSLSKVFDLWNQDTALSTTFLRYRFRLLQNRYMNDNALETLDILRLVSPLNSDDFAESLLLKSLGSGHVNTSKVSSYDSAAYFGLALCNLLRASESGDISPSPITIPKLKHAVRSSNEYSAPLLQLYLHIGLQQPETHESLLNVIFGFAQNPQQLNALSDRKVHFMLSSLSPEASRKIREKAEQSFFAMLPPYTLTSVSMDPDEKGRNESKAANFISIISLTAHGSPAHASDRDTSVGPTLFEKLSGLLKQGTLGESDSQRGALTQANVKYLAHLLNLVSLHRDTLSPHSSATPTNASPVKPDQSPLKILIALISIALHPNFSDIPADVSFHILDTAALLVDNLSSESLALVSRLLKDRAKDPRAEFLLGNLNSTSSSFSSEEGDLGFLAVKPDGSGTTSSKILGEWRPKPWEMLEGGAEPSLGLGLFAAKRTKG